MILTPCWPKAGPTGGRLCHSASDLPVASKKSSPRMAALFADLGLAPAGRSVLDVGCGNGKLLAGLRDSGYDDLWGTELSPWRVAVSALRFPDRIFEGGYAAIPEAQRFAAGKFDIYVVVHAGRGTGINNAQTARHAEMQQGCAGVSAD